MTMRPLQKAAMRLLVSLLLASFSGSQVARAGQALLMGQSNFPDAIWLGTNLVVFGVTVAVALRILYRTAWGGRAAEQGEPPHE